MNDLIETPMDEAEDERRVRRRFYEKNSTIAILGVLFTILLSLGGWGLLKVSANDSRLTKTETEQKSMQETLETLSASLTKFSEVQQNTYDLVKAIDTRQQLTDKEVGHLKEDLKKQGDANAKETERVRDLEKTAHVHPI